MMGAACADIAAHKLSEKVASAAKGFFMEQLFESGGDKGQRKLAAHKGSAVARLPPGLWGMATALRENPPLPGHLKRS